MRSPVVPVMMDHVTGSVSTWVSECARHYCVHTQPRSLTPPSVSLTTHHTSIPARLYIHTRKQTTTGYRERFVLDCCIPLPNGKEVRLRQAPSAKQFSTQPHPGSNNSQHRQQQQQSHSKHSKHNSKHGSKHNKQPQKDVDKQSDPALTGST